MINECATSSQSSVEGGVRSYVSFSVFTGGYPRVP